MNISEAVEFVIENATFPITTNEIKKEVEKCLEREISKEQILNPISKIDSIYYDIKIQKYKRK